MLSDLQPKVCLHGSTAPGKQTLAMCECSFCTERGRERDTLKIKLNVLTSGVNSCLAKRWQRCTLLEDKS